MKLSQSQWAALWIAEGGNPRKAWEASAIVMAESGGDATSDSNPCCKGGWQINVEVGNTTRACAMNPVCATRWSIKESKNGKDWSAWEAYTNGSYRQFMGGKPSNRKLAESASNTKLAGFHIPGWDEGLKDILPDVPGGSALDLLEGLPGEGIISNLTDIGAFFKGLGELLFTPEGWLRIAKMLGGSLLFLWGLRIVIRESTGTDPVGTVEKVAGTAAAVAAIK